MIMKPYLMQQVEALVQPLTNLKHAKCIEFHRSFTKCAYFMGFQFGPWTWKMSSPDLCGLLNIQ